MAICSACGANLPAEARFCPACGASAAEQQGEMLKLVTVLFADVVSSTARGERMHPEDVRALMADYFGAMSQAIRAEGGTIEKFVGDAIMAVFGVPSAHEDDPLRAVRAARRMLARLDEWNAARPESERLEIRIGVNTGDVIAAGAPGADLLVTGDAVNVAARLQQAAESGQILVGERTARAVRGFFEVEGLEPLELKGKQEAVPASRVVGERATPEERGVPGPMAPMVGRDDELEILRSNFARVQTEGAPQLITLVGDAGVGKSRLAREFVASLDVEAKVTVGRCLPYGEGVTLWPLGEILKSEALVLETDTRDVALEKVALLAREAIPAELKPEPERTVAALASTVGLRPVPDPLAELDPRDVYRELLRAWRALLAGLAAGAPLVVAIEDLHWADSTMLDVLDDLTEHVEGPVLFLCTTRPDLLRSRPGWGGGKRNYSSLPLDPLTAEESAQLVSFLLAVEDLPKHVKERILERAEGNPFFLEEIVRHLIDEGLLAAEDGKWRARDEIAEVQISDNVQAVILARLDLLAPDERRVVQEAAVVGRVFWGGAVARLAGVDRLEQIVQTLERRELILERLSSAMAGETEYMFKHVLIRDVAYESLPRSERARAHAEVAAWIEHASGDRAEELAELLAHHYDAAFSLSSDAHPRAAAHRYYLVATRSAARRLAIHQGERFGRRAVELSETSDEQVEALEALGDVYYTVFHGDGAYGAYTQALRELSSSRRADRARLTAKAATLPARWLGTLHRKPEFERLESLIDDGLEAAGESDSRERAMLLAFRAMASLQYGRRSESAREELEEALAIAARLDDPDVLSAALDGLSSLHLAVGRYGEGWRATERRVALVNRLRDPKEIGDVFAMAAWESFHRGLYRGAVAHASVCIERSRGVDPPSLQHGLVWRIVSQFMLGDWDAALSDQAELEELHEQDARGLPPGFTLKAYSTAGLCHELRGERARAGEYVLLLDRYAKSQGGEEIGVIARTSSPPAARLLVHQGRIADVARYVRFPVASDQASGLQLEALTDVVASGEDWVEARRIVERAREEAEVGELVALPFFADRLEGRMLAAADDLDTAVARLHRSATGFAELGALWEEAWSRLLLADVLVAAGRDEAEPELRAALAVFERLQSVRELERAQSLLEQVPA